MQDLREQLEALTDTQQQELLLNLCRQALPVWEAYCAARPALTYIESVVGTTQRLDPELPTEALTAVATGSDTARIAQRYREPIAALQDGDLSFPNEVEMAYYAIYNLFQSSVGGRPQDPYRIIDQALAAHGSQVTNTQPLLAALREVTR